ncbi:O-fucosyltransferase 35-like [Salvia hispanica]|uniref:O-fucosyltransferase 35-like n=1 Tax=Salvia hispanica TaxID=49212 RepID=UPI0020094732|nr:O-fucosyltransferase 35-like [Salvia hispanica]
MGRQHNSHHHHTATDGGGGGGLSQRVNSPRFSGPMTRCAHSFKQNNANNTNNNSNRNNSSNVNNSSSSNNQHEVIDLNLNSPRSESARFRRSSGAEGSFEEEDFVAERGLGGIRDRIEGGGEAGASCGLMGFDDGFC